MATSDRHLKVIHSVSGRLIRERTENQGLAIVRALCEAQDDAAWTAAFQEFVRFETSLDLKPVMPTNRTAPEEACNGPH